MKPHLFLLLPLLASAVAVAQRAPANPAPKPSAPAKLGSTVFDWTKLTVVPTKTGERRAIANAPTVNLANFESHVTTLRPGEAPHAAHTHPDEEIVIVKDGTLEVMANGQSQRVGPGSMIFFASNESHGVCNGGDTPVTYFIIRLVTPECARAAAAAKP